MKIILEQGAVALFGQIEHDDFLLTTSGKDKEEVTKNLRESLDDFLQHEGKGKPNWEGVKAENVVFEYEYE